MTSCPSCHASVEILEKHLGTLFTCPHCNSVYFIDWNGQPELGHHEPEPEEELREEPQEQSQEQSEELQQDPRQDQLLYEPPAPAAYETSTPYESFSPQLESPGESAEPIKTEGEESSPYDFSQTLDATTEASFAAEQNVSDSADFSDVTDFANADTSGGPISYSLTIEGIDTAKLASDLKEAMTDSRFGWDVEEIFKTKSRDTLVLRSLSPAKASILVSRIKYLPFKISWRQDVLTGT